MLRPFRHERIFGWLLRLFPAEFRGDFGDQMTDDFRDQREDALNHGRRSAWRLWLCTVGDVFRRAPAEHLDILRRDAACAIRLLTRRPALAATAIVTLAIGIGVTTAVFSLAYHVLWHPLPLADPDRLVNLTETDLQSGQSIAVSGPNFLDWQTRTRAMESMAVVTSAGKVIVDGGEPEELLASNVSRDFFRLMHARPALGRLFEDRDFAAMATQPSAGTARIRRAAPSIVVLSFELWQRRFHGSPDVVGRTVRLAGDTLQIVGVAAQGTGYPYRLSTAIDCWLPFVPDPESRRARYLKAFGRLAPDASLATAQAEFTVIASQLATEHPQDNQGHGARVESLLETYTGAAKTQLWLLLGAAACVLLIACANVANLLLAHASGRRLELATRAALGGSRAHLVRQALTEGAVLAGLGGVSGGALAFWIVPLLVSVAPTTVPRLNEVVVDGRALFFAGMLSLVVGLACGLGGSLSINATNPSALLRSSGSDAEGQGRRFRYAVTVAEIGVAMVLVIGAGLLVRTLRVVGSLELGFNPANTISVGLTRDVRKGTLESKSRFEDELLTRVRKLPGVVAAGIGSLPLQSGGMGTSMSLPSRPGEDLPIRVDAVSPGYLEALGARLVAGRFVDGRDTAGASHVALVNETAVKKYWPAGEVLGKTIKTNDVLVIVGVVADVRRGALEEEPQPTLYIASAQTPTFWTNNMLVRTSGDPHDVLSSLRGILNQLEPDQALTRIQTLDERLAAAIAPRRYVLWLVGLFSLVAVGLAGIGVYAVVAETVARRIPEIGIRVALGATPGDVIGLVLREGVWMISSGLCLGLLVALALSGVMAGFVFRVQTTDPLSYFLAGACLAAITLAGCVLPAWRASRIDPVLALRAA